MPHCQQPLDLGSSVLLGNHLGNALRALSLALSSTLFYSDSRD